MQIVVIDAAQQSWLKVQPSTWTIEADGSCSIANAVVNQWHFDPGSHTRTCACKWLLMKSMGVLGEGGVAPLDTIPIKQNSTSKYIEGVTFESNHPKAHCFDLIQLTEWKHTCLELVFSSLIRKYKDICCLFNCLSWAYFYSVRRCFGAGVTWRAQVVSPIRLRGVHRWLAKPVVHRHAMQPASCNDPLNL